LSNKTTRSKSLAKGILAGLIGGLVATAAKSLAEKIYSSHSNGEPGRPVLLAGRVAGHELTVVQTKEAAEAIQWGFGAATGAAYGALAEYVPTVTSKDGASFGMALVTLTHQGTLPMLGLAAHPGEQTAREKASEMTSHIVYGIVTETVRRVVRQLLR
jgi:putative membrane protein